MQASLSRTFHSLLTFVDAAAGCWHIAIMGKLIRLELFSMSPAEAATLSFSGHFNDPGLTYSVLQTSNPTRVTIHYYLATLISPPSLVPMDLASLIRAFPVFLKSVTFPATSCARYSNPNM